MKILLKQNSKDTNLKSENTKIKLINFGCKVNLYDGQIILQKLKKENEKTNQVFIVNTCTVTEKSATDCQKEVRKIVRNNPHVKVIVTGCDATINPSKYKLSPNIYVYSNFQKNDITLQTVYNQKLVEPTAVPIAKSEPWQLTPDQGENQKRKLTINKNYRTTLNTEHLEKIYGRTRAFVKIEDGCDLFCSFCIIPYTRGLPVSKPIPKILEEINVLLNNGYKEIVLTGIHIGCFGKDLKNDTNLVKLIENLYKFSNYEFRFRLSSIEIQEVDDKLLSVLQYSKNFCPHFHLPLQSGSNKILKLMNRRYTAEYLIEKIQQIKGKFDTPSFSTDVIIGFPTETDEDFHQTLKICEMSGFFKIHIFPYSDRYITPATKLNPKIDRKTIKQRYKELSLIEEKNQNQYYQQFLNKECIILTERFHPEKSSYFGYTERYLKAMIYVKDNNNLHNKFIRVKPHHIENKHLISYL